MAKLLSSLQEVRALVPDSIYKRAKELASADKFKRISFEGQNLQKSSATCAGSNPGDNYNISIIVNAESSCKPLCLCSCPAAIKTKGGLCKHVVALLLLRTKEFERKSKERANESILSEFKLVEDRLAEGRSSLSDSQATEPFSPSENKGKLTEGDTATTASSDSLPVKNNQKRVLPGWISGGFTTEANPPKKEHAGSVRKQSKTNLTTNTTEDDCKIKRSSTKPQKGRNEIEVSIAEDSLEKIPKQPPRASKRTRKVHSTVKHYEQVASKRRKAKTSIESNLSKQDEPEKIDDVDLSESREDIDLTSEDLVNLAKQHLEKELSSGGHQPEEDNSESNNKLDDLKKAKSKGSIFSVRGWNEITKGDSFNVSQPSEAKCSGEITASSSVLSSENMSVNVKPSENIVDDMLGLFFGPSLSKSVNCKYENTQPPMDDVLTSSATPFSKIDTPDINLPVSTDDIPKPKKKGSLKDKVMMFLD